MNGAKLCILSIRKSGHVVKEIDIFIDHLRDDLGAPAVDREKTWAGFRGEKGPSVDEGAQPLDLFVDRNGFTICPR